MRYWLYQDARILGPFSREDLLAQPGVGPDSLVCEEGASGSAEKDWRILAALAEASPETALASAAAPVAAAAGAGGASSFLDFQRDASAALEALGLGGEWNPALLSEPELSDLWPPELQRPIDDELIAMRDQRTSELEDRLVHLKEEFLEAQKRQEELATELERKNRLLADREDALADLQRSLQRRRVAQSELEAGAPPKPAPKVPETTWDVELPSAKLPEAAAPSASVQPPAAPEAAPPSIPVLPPAAAAPSIPILPPAAPEAAASSIPILPSAAPEAAAPSIPILPPAAPEAAAPSIPVLPPAAPEIPALSAAPALEVPAPAAPEIPALSAPPALDAAPPLDAAVPALEAAPPPLDAAPPALEAAPPPLDAAAPALEAAPPPLDAAPPGLSEGASLSSTLDLPPPIDFNAQLAAQPAEAPAPAFDAPAVPSTATPNPFEQAKTVIFSGSTAGEQAVPALQPPQVAPTNPFMPQPGPQTPMPVDAGAGAQLGQPKTMLFGSPGTPSPEALASMALTPPPVPLASGGETTSSGEIPLTVRGAVPAASGQPGLPENLWGARTPVPTEIPGTGGKPFEDLFAPATPVPVPTGSTPMPSPVTVSKMPAAETKTVKPRSSKAFLIGLGAAAVVLILVAVFFLRDPRQVQMLFSMSPQKKRAPAEGTAQPSAGAPENPASAQGEPSARPASPFPPQAPQGQAAPAPQPAAQAYPAPAPQGAPPAQAAPEPAPAPEQGRDFIQDEGVLSLEFVKNFYLDKERGTVAQWLQYSFMSPGNEDEWVAAAVQAKVYLVTYRVFQGGRAKRGVQPITYLFEADLEKKTLVGRNPAAKDLLGASSSGDGTPEGARAAAELEAEGTRASAKPAPNAGGKAAASKRAKPKAAKKAKAPARRAEDEQLPLPEEGELDRNPAAPPSSGFNNPGADSVELAP